MPKPNKNRRVASRVKIGKRNAKKTETAKCTSGLRPLTIGPAAPEEEAAFTETLIVTGQAARLNKDGKLPAGATHKIVEDDAGRMKVVRRRFSMT